MAEKGFGVKEVNLIGASGTPTIESPNNLNLNAVNVAISTNVSIGGTLSVTGNVSVGGTLTYEDVTNIDSVGIITARSDVIVGRGLTVTGISTFSGDVHFSLHGAGNPKIQFDESGDLLWFKKATTGGSSSKIGLGGGISYDHLQLQQTYTGGGQSEITAYNSNILISAISAEKNITIQSTNDITLANGTYPFIKCEENSSSDQSVTLYYGQTGSTPYANPKLQTTSTGVNVTGALTVNGSALSITPTDSDIQVAYTVTANGSSAYRFAGNGVVSTADDPDLYLIRGQKYRFINNSGGSHPFQIREASGGTAYSTGVTNNGASSGNIDFAPTYDSPAQLVYQCTSHSGMVGNIYLRDAAGGNINVGVTTFSENVTVSSGKKLFIGTTTEGQDDADNLTIDGSGEGTGRTGITIRSATNTFGSIFFSDATSGTGEYDGVVAYDHSNQTMRFSTASTQRMFINSNGHVTKPSQPMFAAQGSGDAISAQSALPFDSINYNIGSHWNNSTFKFTCPVTGYYYVTAHVIPQNFTSNNGNCELYVRMDAAGARLFLDRKAKLSNYGSNNFSVGGSRIVYATANQTISVELNSIEGSPTLEPSSHLGIMLMA